MPRKYNRYQKQILLNMPGATHFRNLCKYNILKEKNTTQKQQECNFSLILRSCFKFIPRQIETYVEADWSPRYAANSGLLTKIKGFKMQDRDSIWPEHTSLQ